MVETSNSIVLETDYLIIGAGAMAMAFVDEILFGSCNYGKNQNTEFIIIDKHAKPGGKKDNCDLNQQLEKKHGSKNFSDKAGQVEKDLHKIRLISIRLDRTGQCRTGMKMIGQYKNTI